MGGYTEGCTSDSFGDGFKEAYRVESIGADSMELTANLANGVSVRRVLALEADRPALIVSSTYANRSNQPAELMANCEFVMSLGRLPDVRMFRRDVSGAIVDVAAEVPDGVTVSDSQWVLLRGERLPAGMWGCFNEHLGLGLSHTFNPGQVAKCNSNAYTSDQHVLIETIGVKTIVGPGNELNFQHSYEVIHEWPL